MCAKISSSTWVWQLLYVEAVLNFSAQPLGLWIINLKFQKQLPGTSADIQAWQPLSSLDVIGGEAIDIARPWACFSPADCGREASRFKCRGQSLPRGPARCFLCGWRTNAWARVLAQEKEVGGSIAPHKNFQWGFGREEESVWGTSSTDKRQPGSPTCFRFHLQHLIWMFIKAFTSCLVSRVL